MPDSSSFTSITDAINFLIDNELNTPAWVISMATMDAVGKAVASTVIGLVNTVTGTTANLLSHHK